jgi:para-aminobenzoate synthetase/4-amino-4-deoxychorismate lyase
MEPTLTLSGWTDPIVILDHNATGDPLGLSYIFHSPDHIISAVDLDGVPAALAALDAAAAEGFHLAGWIAYECAAVFEPKLRSSVKVMPREPLIWMMATRHREALSKEALKQRLVARQHDQISEPSETAFAFADKGLAQNTYEQMIEAIKNYITAGDVYQVNYTFPRACKYSGSIYALYSAIREQQPVAYGAFIDTGEHEILSFSPELFFRRDGNTLTAQPMKGTIKRGATKQDDARLAKELAADEKSRAENLMIVDLIRNDLSRIAQAGSVKVDHLFAVEAHPTLHQMTSHVSATCVADLTPSQALAALFPCGSVTGAPKLRAMEIIASLETAPRGVYCGAIGHFSPAESGHPVNWCFNVPIRTFVFGQDKSGRMGIGSGIVDDSVLGDEYAECLLKSMFAEQVQQKFSPLLIETMRLEAGSVALLERHLDRLAVSAATLQFTFERDSVKTAVMNAVAKHRNDTERAAGVFRLRCLVGANGLPVIEINPLAPQIEAMPEVQLALERVQSSDPFLRHKTTLRDLYTRATACAAEHGLADILFLNEKGQVAEGAISTLFITKGERLITPPLSSGALPGILRAEMMANQSAQMKPNVIEKVITVEDLFDAKAVYIGNALRGLLQVRVKKGRLAIAESVGL